MEDRETLPKIRRIAMWSGPRNLSTAMMRSFSSRPDCAVWDEPFYGAYLASTGMDHPLRDDVLAAWENDYNAVCRRCVEDCPEEKPVFYQKHMTHHMIEGFSLSWLSALTNVFLIRHPARVVASYAAKWDKLTLADLGFERQAEIFDHVRKKTGVIPAVIDTDDLLADPPSHLEALCAAIGIDYTPAMLHWQPGPHPADGPWAPHWYGSLWKSTGFARARPLDETKVAAHRQLVDQAMPLYERLSAFRIVP